MKVAQYVNECLYYGELPSELNFNLFQNYNNYLRRLPKGFENMIGGEIVIKLMMDDVREGQRKRNNVSKIINDHYDGISVRQINLHYQTLQYIYNTI